jgi:predicted  nucleic acid-binding Zn-ribbon protein
MHLVDSGAPDRSRTLAELNEEERAVSARRAKLHNRIDFLRTGGGGPLEDVADVLTELEREERQVSDYRRELHKRIELLRTEPQRSRP